MTRKLNKKKNTKIVLSTLPSEGEFVNWTAPKYFVPKKAKYMPLGILSLASNLPKEYDIQVLDPATEDWNIEETIEKIELEKPDILGLSSLTRRVWAMNEILRKTSAPYKVVGGPHVTYYANQTLKSGADAVFVGQLADKEFASAVENKPKGVVSCNTKINEIDFPKRDFLNIENYFFKGKGHLFEAIYKRFPIFSSIGCPHKCSFCNVQSKKIQYKNPKSILDEMEYIYSMDVKNIHILDDNFNINPNHVKGILDEIEKRKFNIEWSGRGQVKTNLNLTRRLADSGFKRIHVGIEALDDNILKWFNKNQTVKDIEKFCETINKNNIDIIGFFICGGPLETEEYKTKLPQRIRDLEIKYPLFTILFPEPDTEYYRSLLKEGYYKKDYWAEFMENPTPYFKIPYPYGEEREKEVIDYSNSLIEEFKK